MTNNVRLQLADPVMGELLASVAERLAQFGIQVYSWGLVIANPLDAHGLSSLSGVLTDPLRLTPLVRSIHEMQSRLLLDMNDLQLADWIREVVEDGRWAPVPEAPAIDDVADALARVCASVGSRLRDRITSVVAAYINGAPLFRDSSTAIARGRASRILLTQLAIIRRFRLTTCAPYVRRILSAPDLRTLIVAGETVLERTIRTLAAVPSVLDEHLLLDHVRDAPLTLDCFRALVAIDTRHRSLYWDLAFGHVASRVGTSGELQALAEIYLSASGVPVLADARLAFEHLLHKPAPPDARIIAGMVRAIERLFHVQASIAHTATEPPQPSQLVFSESPSGPGAALYADVLSFTLPNDEWVALAHSVVGAGDTARIIVELEHARTFAHLFYTKGIIDE